MAEEFDSVAAPEEDNKTRWIIIVVVILILLCCCCCIAGFGGNWLWENGDQLLEDWGLAIHLTQLIL
jgi:hypothetical protein